MLRADRAVLALIVSMVAGTALAQTSVPGVRGDRPDQNPATRGGRGAAVPQPARERNPDKPLAPFTLTGVDVAGSSLSSGQLSAAYSGFIGKTIDNKGLGQLVDAVAHAYEASDIALYTVLVPEQRFADGRLRLSVVEGYIASVEVRGKLREVRRPLLRAYLRRIERERPLHKSTLQRTVSLIRDMPGLIPDLNFQRGAAQGAVKLVVDVREKPLQLAIGINDRGTALLGRTQVQADAYVNGILSGADQLHGTMVLPTHVSRFQFYSGSYLTPLDADGDTLQFNLGYLRTRPPIIEFGGQTFRLKGRAISFGGQFSRPLIRSYQRNLYLTAGVDGIDTHNALLGFILSNDRVRTLRAALAFNLAAKRNELNISGTVSQGLDVLGARVIPGQAEKGFRKLNLKIADNVAVGRSFVLRLSATGQATGDLLPGSEQLALGGDEFGRAYESALIAGDQGYAGSAELAFRSGKLPDLIAGSELYAFADGGRVWYSSRFGFPRTESHLASIGAGARLRVAARTVFQLEGVKGLNNPVFYEDRKNWRMLFSVRTLL